MRTRFGDHAACGNFHRKNLQRFLFGEFKVPKAQGSQLVVGCTTVRKVAVSVKGQLPGKDGTAGLFSCHFRPLAES